MNKYRLTAFTLCGAVWFVMACSPPRTSEISTVSGLIQAAGGRFERAELWQAAVTMRLTSPRHISEWEGVIYSDGDRFAAVVNGASRAGRLDSRLVIDGSGVGKLEANQDGIKRVYTFRADASALGEFTLPGNPGIGNVIGMFLDPARALRTLESTYDLRFNRRSKIGGEPGIAFRGTIRPEALAQIDPEGYLAQVGLPIDEVDVTVRLLDGAPGRIQFIENNSGYFLIEYQDIDTEPERVEERFVMDTSGMEIFDVTDAAQNSVAGVNETHVLFDWDESQRILPRAN